MATTGGGRPAAKTRGAGLGGRSLVFYAWCCGAAQVLFLLGAIAFVVVGSRLQQEAIAASSSAQRLQLSNQVIQTDFLNAQASIRGFMLTGQDRFLQSYYTERALFTANLSTARAHAWPAMAPGLERQAQAAQATFTLDDLAITFPRGSPRSAALIGRASARSDQFVAANERLQVRLANLTRAFEADSKRSLGIGLTGAALVLTVALLIPSTLTAVILRWSLRPIIGSTRTVRRLAAGNHDARTTPAGPAEVRDLSLSINLLADESERLRAEQEESARLSAVVTQTAKRVRKHLDADGVTREAVTAIAENLGCDYVWVGLVKGTEITLPVGNRRDWGLRRAVIESIPPEYIEMAANLYHQRASYCLNDLHSDEAEAVLPRRIREMLLGFGGTALLFTPFGTGRELLGELTLLRSTAGRPWTPAEISAVESVAVEVGRGLDHARLYEQEKDLVEKLKEVDRAKSDFLVAVSHDLRAPLTSIVGFAEMLDEDEREPLSDRHRTMLGAIQRNASRLDNLIDDLLTMSKIEMGSFETELRRLDLATVVRAVAGEIRATAEGKGLEFGLSGPEHGLMVNGDKEQLDRALTNLISNAVKYTSRGGRVDISARREGDQAVVETRDTGIGIPEKDQPSLFTRFYRASNVVHTSFPGTGLGLAIVATIVSNHHGEVALQSREGVGTTVTMRLPLAPEPPPRQEAGPVTVSAAQPAARSARASRSERRAPS